MVLREIYRLENPYKEVEVDLTNTSLGKSIMDDIYFSKYGNSYLFKELADATQLKEEGLQMECKFNKLEM